MEVVLGIDPAWTRRQPSGVCLLARDHDRWRCVVMAPSYESFIATGAGRPVRWDEPVSVGEPDVEGLLRACRELVPDARIRVVTLDMPIARSPFTSRRVADNEATRALSRFGCAVHSPTPARPGPLGVAMSDAFVSRGFAIATTAPMRATRTPLLEVYPHPAIMTLLGENYRAAYKSAKTSAYWPDAPLEERVERILAVWRRILEALARDVDGVTLPLPSRATGVRLSHLKRFEDALDALVCAWVGTEFLAGRCRALGDEDAAIWIPDRLPERSRR